MRWTASVHTLHMSKPVITFVVKVLCDGLPRYILYTCLQPVITLVFKVPSNGPLNSIKLAQTQSFLRESIFLNTCTHFGYHAFFMCALKLLSSNVACASCLFLLKNHKFHMRQKKDAKTSQNTDVSNVHFLLQITYETP